MNPKTETLKTRIRWILAFFIAALVISGATAIPVETELTNFLMYFPGDNAVGNIFRTVLNGVRQTKASFPFLLYGYDWLAFAHFVIAVAFIGPFKEPVKNIWVIEFGMIACAMVVPFALIFATVRGLPFWWSLVDCSFGIIGILPLWYCRNRIIELQVLLKRDRENILF
jgi:hypothetical protein